LFSKTAEGLGPMAAAGSRGSWWRRRTGGGETHGPGGACVV